MELKRQLGLAFGKQGDLYVLERFYLVKRCSCGGHIEDIDFV